MTTLIVRQAFDNYSVGDQLVVAYDAALRLRAAYPGRFALASGDVDMPVSPPDDGDAPSGLTIDQVDAEIALALAAHGLPSGATVPGLIAAALTAQGVETAQLITALQQAAGLGGWSGFVTWAAGTGALGVDASSPLWVASQLKPYASPTGVLASAIGAYLRAPPASGGLGLTATVAATQMVGLFSAAAQVPN